jgi:hypothetical protein
MELSYVCKFYRHSISSNKRDLVACIRLGMKPEAPQQTTGLDCLTHAWCMKPLAKRHYLRLGAQNEHNVLMAVCNIHLYDKIMKVERGPIEFGLVFCVDKK